MKIDNEMHQRRSVRLKGYDYSEAGACFVTVCTYDKECMFGVVTDGAMQLNVYGRIVMETWQKLPEHFLHVELDEFVVMPNHVHGIIVINGRGMACRARTKNDAPTNDECAGKAGTAVERITGGGS